MLAVAATFRLNFKAKAALHVVFYRVEKISCYPCENSDFSAFNGNLEFEIFASIQPFLHQLTQKSLRNIKSED
jgi:hypothetical protein